MFKDYDRKIINILIFFFNYCISKKIYKDYSDRFCFNEIYNFVLELFRMVVL